MMKPLGHWARAAKNTGQGRVDALPFVEQLLENYFAVRRQAVEALVALLFFAPFAGEQALCFDPSQ